MSPEKLITPETKLYYRIEIVDKNPVTFSLYQDLIAEWPEQFIPGEELNLAVEEDFNKSEIIFAYDNNSKTGKPIGCLMFDRSSSTYNWLAISKKLNRGKVDIAKSLFESIYPSLKEGEVVHMYPNTEDSSGEGVYKDIGNKFVKARRLYSEMGFAHQMVPENVIKDYYGLGAHVYHISWTPKPITDN